MPCNYIAIVVSPGNIDRFALLLIIIEFGGDDRVWCSLLSPLRVAITGRTHGIANRRAALLVI